MTIRTYLFGTFCVIIIIIISGCISFNKSDDDKEEQRWISLEVKSITSLKDLQDDEFFISFTLGDKSKEESFINSTWGNIITLRPVDEGKVYTFSVEINNNGKFQFLDSFNRIEGEINYKDETISITINSEYDGFYTINQDVSYPKGYYNIHTEGLDGEVEFVISTGGEALE